MPDNPPPVIVVTDQVKLPDIPLTDAELIAWIEAKKKEEEAKK